MARYLEAKCKLCRRADMKLFLKGVRCITEKCSFAKRPKPPGKAMPSRAKLTNYALQLREKQKLKNMYGMLERQFRRFFTIANRSRGVTGKTLIRLLEKRLDNVVYRSLFASSREQARQIVLHGFVFVSGKRVNIPSYIVRQGQNIEVKPKGKFQQFIKDNIDLNSKDRSSPGWLKIDNSNFKIDIVREPEKEDLVIPIDEQLVVELYSK
ncbi:MAG: 30S ribosomal protein S4 [Candidatus Omnitrophica bacterium]|nr:30S ribosomal protein S4 [Candidatus Omnitrophota bacterium]